MRIEARNEAVDLDPSKAVNAHASQLRRYRSHQRFVAGSNALGLRIVRVTRRGVAREEIDQRLLLRPVSILTSYQAREVRG